MAQAAASSMQVTGSTPCGYTTCQTSVLGAKESQSINQSINLRLLAV